MIDSGLDNTLMALADPTRRAILQRLSRGEARVTELAEPFAMSLNAVSKHIQVLERARLVQRRRAGREHFLSFDPTPLEQAAAWIESTRAFWNARLDALDALFQAEDREAAVTHISESSIDEGGNNDRTPAAEPGADAETGKHARPSTTTADDPSHRKEPR